MKRALPHENKNNKKDHKKRRVSMTIRKVARVTVFNLPLTIMDLPLDIKELFVGVLKQQKDLLSLTMLQWSCKEFSNFGCIKKATYDLVSTLKNNSSSSASYICRLDDYTRINPDCKDINVPIPSRLSLSDRNNVNPGDNMRGRLLKMLAIEKGYINIWDSLEVLFPTTKKLYDNDKAQLWAARGGKIEVFKKLKESRYKWDLKMYNYAAVHGHMEALKWLVENAKDWFDETKQRYTMEENEELKLKLDLKGYKMTKHASVGAASNNHVHILQWIYDNGYPLSKVLFVKASQKGHLDVLLWGEKTFGAFSVVIAEKYQDYLCNYYEKMRENRTPYHADKADERSIVIVDGDNDNNSSNFNQNRKTSPSYFNTLNFVCKHHNDIWISAIENGHLNILSWGLDNNFMSKELLTKNRLKISPANFRFILNWVKKYKLVKHVDLFNAACSISSKNKLDVLRHLKAIQYPFSKHEHEHAAIVGDTETLQWLYDNDYFECGSNYSKVEFYISAMKSNSTKVLDWLKKNHKVLFNTNDTFKYDKNNGDDDHNVEIEYVFLEALCHINSPCVAVLEWGRVNGISYEHGFYINQCTTETLEWIRKHNYNIFFNWFNQDIINPILERKGMIDWLWKYYFYENYSVRFFRYIIQFACTTDNVKLLDWVDERSEGSENLRNFGVNVDDITYLDDRDTFKKYVVDNFINNNEISHSNEHKWMLAWFKNLSNFNSADTTIYDEEYTTCHDRRVFIETLCTDCAKQGSITCLQWLFTKCLYIVNMEKRRKTKLVHSCYSIAVVKSKMDVILWLKNIFDIKYTLNLEML